MNLRFPRELEVLAYCYKQNISFWKQKFQERFPMFTAPIAGACVLCCVVYIAKKRGTNFVHGRTMVNARLNGKFNSSYLLRE